MCPLPSGIDGGNLGFLTWTIPTMIGTLACDTVMTPRSRAAILTRLFGWGAVLMAIGWILSCGTRMYDVPPSDVAKLAKEQACQRSRAFPRVRNSSVGRPT